MKIGFIGIGHIGEMVVRRLLERPRGLSFAVTSRHGAKYRRLGKKLGIATARSVAELVQMSDIIFICVRPQDLEAVLREIGPQKNKLFITTVAAVPQNFYYRFLGRAQLVTYMPSIVNEWGGPVLFVPGKYATPSGVRTVKKLLGSIGTVMTIKERELDAYTALTGCSPALIPEFLRLYTESMQRAARFDRGQALEALIGVMEFLPELLRREGFGIIERVCTKGGITERGVLTMRRHEKTFFDELTRALLGRMKEIRREYE